MTTEQDARLKLIQAWEHLVLTRTRDLCANCGSNIQVRARMVVPESLGGNLHPENGVALCRSCRVISSIHQEPETNSKTPISFWMSRAQSLQMNEHLEAGVGYRTQSALVRHLVQQYVADPESFQDLVELAEEDVAEVKWNLWVDSGLYTRFKNLLQETSGLSVRAALCGMLRIYASALNTLNQKESEHVGTSGSTS